MAKIAERVPETLRDFSDKNTLDGWVNDAAALTVATLPLRSGKPGVSVVLKFDGRGQIS
ncbi:MAG: hypothetical protein ACLQL2_11855 [Methylovirgula sp.]